MMGNITHAPTFDSFLMCIRLSCVIVQGLSVSDSPLMQLPHIDEDKLSFFQRRKKSLNTVQSFVELNEKDYNFLLKGFSEYQKSDIFLAIEAMPHLNIEIALKVDDEINPVSIESLSIVSILIRIKRISLSKQFKFPLEIIDSSPASCTNSHLNSGQIPQTTFAKKNFDWDSFSPEAKKKDPKHFAHAPYFPFTKKEGWWIYVLDAYKQLVCIPVYFHFTQKYHQMVLQMFSSGDVGLLTYKCYIVSDSYVDFNYQKEITMNVVKQQPIVIDHPQWKNDSDEEQDKVDSDVLTDSEEPITADLTVA
uniref:Translocation protein SEC63 homolog (Trinotate prediction) n=1 Tax=Myxobolus squamalis TaxID=59785 RepID=A0A6B2FXV4_MYXSQ